MFKTAARAAVVDYVHPHFTVDIAFKSALSQEIILFNTLLMPFDLPTWLCIALCSNIVAIVLLVMDAVMFGKLNGENIIGSHFFY